MFKFYRYVLIHVIVEQSKIFIFLVIFWDVTRASLMRLYDAIQNGCYRRKKLYVANLNVIWEWCDNSVTDITLDIDDETISTVRNYNRIMYWYALIWTRA